MTGKYVHNQKTYENGVGAGCNAPSWRELNEKKTMGAYLSGAGYTTGFFGELIIITVSMYQTHALQASISTTMLCLTLVWELSTFLLDGHDGLH